MVRNVMAHIPDAIRRFFGKADTGPAGKQDRGSMSIVAGLILAPLVVLTVGSVLTTRHLSVWTRTHQAQTAAVLAVTKEGEDASGEERSLMVQAWLNEDLNALKLNDIWTPSLSGTQDTELLGVTWTPTALLDEFMNAIFQNPVDDTVRAERFYRPIEAVVVLDASMSANPDLMRKIADRVTEKLFRGNESASDVRMSLVNFGAHVNIGTEYADKLITPESRMLAKPGTALGKNKSEEMYAAQVKTLSAYNSSLVNDLLAPGGPGSDWDMACVARPSAYPSGDASAYKDTVEEAPGDPTEGFTLIMGDGRSIQENRGDVYGTDPRTPFTSYYLMMATGDSDSFVYGVDITRLSLVPPQYVVDSERTDYNKYEQWGGASQWANIKDEVVMWYYDCPAMPMLIGADNVKDVEERMEMFRPAWTTGQDEGLAWALRALAPKWSDIWEKGENFPAQYHSTTEKRILMTIGSGTTSDADAYMPLCEMAKDNGIQTYLLVPDGDLRSEDRPKFQDCTVNGNLVEDIESDDELVEIFGKFATRHYRVRLVDTI